MTKPIEKKTPPPEWMGEVVKILWNAIKANPRAADLLKRPEVAEAKKKLDAAWKRRKNVREPYPAHLFAEAVNLCIFYGEQRTPMEFPRWMIDREEAARLAKNTSELVEVADGFVKFLGGPDNGPLVSVAHEWPEVYAEGKVNAVRMNFLELAPLADAQGVVASGKILAAVRFLAGHLKMIAEAPRKEGGPENLSWRNLLCGLEDRFLADIGKPLHPVIALLWGAVSGRKKTPGAVKTTLNRYKNR